MLKLQALDNLFAAAQQAVKDANRETPTKPVKAHKVLFNDVEPSKDYGIGAGIFITSGRSGKMIAAFFCFPGEGPALIYAWSRYCSEAREYPTVFHRHLRRYTRAMPSRFDRNTIVPIDLGPREAVPLAQRAFKPRYSRFSISGAPFKGYAYQRQLRYFTYPDAAPLANLSVAPWCPVGAFITIHRRTMESTLGHLPEPHHERRTHRDEG